MSDFITKDDLIIEIESRMRRHKDKGDVSAAYRISELRSLLKAIHKKLENKVPCSTCNGFGLTRMGAMPWETGGDACSSCDGTGKKRAVFYG